MTYDERLGDYNDVASRMREFFDKYPDGRLRPASAWRFETVADKAFVVYEAAAYRTCDDPLPGIGTAWEPFPGRTPYTKDSELMNAETSAWGRAILAVGAADTKKGIASKEEVRNRQADREQQWEDAKPAQPSRPDPEVARQNILANARKALAEADEPGLTAIDVRITHYLKHESITTDDAAELRRLLVARLDEIHPAGEQAAIEPAVDQAELGADWPEPVRPGDPG